MEYDLFVYKLTAGHLPCGFLNGCNLILFAVIFAIVVVIVRCLLILRLLIALAAVVLVLVFVPVLVLVVFFAFAHCKTPPLLNCIFPENSQNIHLKYLKLYRKNDIIYSEILCICKEIKI